MTTALSRHAVHRVLPFIPSCRQFFSLMPISSALNTIRHTTACRTTHWMQTKKVNHFAPSSFQYLIPVRRLATRESGVVERIRPKDTLVLDGKGSLLMDTTRRSALCRVGCIEISQDVGRASDEYRQQMQELLELLSEEKKTVKVSICSEERSVESENPLLKAVQPLVSKQQKVVENVSLSENIQAISSIARMGIFSIKIEF